MRSAPHSPARQKNKRALLAAERHIPQQQVELIHRPPDVFPCPLLHLILPVGVNPAALDAAPPPPLVILERRRRQRISKQLLDPFEAQRHLLLTLGQAIQKVT